MTEALSKFLEFISKYSWAVSITTALLLFLPEEAKKGMGVDSIVSIYKGYIWILFMLSSVLFSGFLAEKCFKKVSSVQQYSKRKNSIKKRIESLSDGEHKTITYCLLKNSQSFRGRVDESDASSLVQRGFAKRGSGNVFNVGYFFYDDVWRALNSERESIISSYGMPEDILIQELEYFMNQKNSFGY